MSVVFLNLLRSTCKTRQLEHVHFVSTSAAKRWFEDGTKKIDPNDKSKNDKLAEAEEKPPEPPPADLCCVSGCPRCVFMEYADELMNYCQRTGTNPHTEIKKITKDPNMQMMIRMLMKE